MESAEPAAVYRERRERFAAQAEHAARRSAALSWARLATLLIAGAAALWVLFAAAAPPAIAGAGALAAGVLFVGLMMAHDRVIRGERRWRALVALNEDGLARLERHWNALPAAPEPPASLLAHLGAALDPPAGELPPRSRDLSLFGPISLARLLSTPRTPTGRQTLCRWLLVAAEPPQIVSRQAAVAELAPAIDFRQQLELAGALPKGSRPASTAPGGIATATWSAHPATRDPEAFLRWAEGEPWLLRHRPVVWLSWFLPPLAWGLGFAALAGVVPGGLPALALVVNLGFTYLFKKRIDGLLDRVAVGADELAASAAALATAAGTDFASPELVRLAAALTAEGDPAARWLARLARGVEIADARHGSFHVFNQVLTLWDFHALARIERWQLAAGRRVRGWLTALGELEALAALAALAHDQPRWAFPEIDTTGTPRLVARDLGHPLLADPVRVGNDVELGPPGTFLLVTGSNMSGKSTLLRALGLNAVLAQAGGPVCAAALRLPPVVVATSILVEDSLADGVSFFLAELRRLKQVVDLAERAQTEDRVLLYLLDEVLRGTNSGERREAIRRVLAHLLARPALGALSTHDLELGDVPEIARAAVPVHFRETIHAAPGDGEATMSFDYRLRPGVATTTNALRLLAAVGLGGEEPAPGAPRGDAAPGSQRPGDELRPTG